MVMEGSVRVTPEQALKDKDFSSHEWSRGAERITSQDWEKSEHRAERERMVSFVHSATSF
jgi:hypothetical protein